MTINDIYIYIYIQNMYISIALYSQTSKRNCCAPVEPLAPCFGLSSAGAELAKLLPKGWR